jgi:hypothetical protein
MTAVMFASDRSHLCDNAALSFWREKMYLSCIANAYVAPIYCSEQLRSPRTWPQTQPFEMRRPKMAWSYEVRGFRDRLVEVRSGFATEEDARGAGSRAKRLIDCVCYPNLEKLTLVTREGDNEPDQLAEIPNAPEEWLEPQSGENGKPSLKYSWQQLVLDAFMEPHSENLLLKINLAERAISSRLLDPASLRAG